MMLTETEFQAKGMSQKLITAPATTVVTLSEAKEFLRIDHSDEDSSVTQIIKAATQRAEELANLKFITQTWQVYFSNFPTKTFLELGIGPLQSVSHVKTYDDDGVATTWANTNYVVSTRGKHGLVMLKSGSSWPDAALAITNGIEVECIVGYGNASAVPEAIKQAVLEICVALYDNRGSPEIKPIPANASALLGPYRYWP